MPKYSFKNTLFFQYGVWSALRITPKNNDLKEPKLCEFPIYP